MTDGTVKTPAVVHKRFIKTLALRDEHTIKTHRRLPGQYVGAIRWEGRKVKQMKQDMRKSMPEPGDY